jgi:hypothetical protein
MSSIKRTITQAHNASEAEQTRRAAFVDLFEQAPLPREELLENLGLFLKRQDLGRMLFLAELYQRILPVDGIVIEFGVRWGRDLAHFVALRGLFEPFNYTRRIVGFDTFAGFPGVDTQDGDALAVVPGAYAVSEGYRPYLEEVLAHQEAESPIAHLRKFELVEGDAAVELERYLAEHPETVVAMAYFDMDVYAPTRACLEMLRPHLTRGSVLGFDELNCPDFPGETLALREVFGLDRLALRRSPLVSYPAYAVID